MMNGGRSTTINTLERNTLLKGARGWKVQKTLLACHDCLRHRINNKQSDAYLTADVEELPVERARCTASLNTCGRQKARSPHALHQRGSDQRPGSCDSMRWERLLCRETLMFPMRTRRRRRRGK